MGPRKDHGVLVEYGFRQESMSALRAGGESGPQDMLAGETVPLPGRL